MKRVAARARREAFSRDLVLGIGRFGDAEGDAEVEVDG
jgi:hypothetical protein